MLPSMSDLFHEDVPDSFIYTVLDACVDAPRHLIMIFTKRVERLAQITNAYAKDRAFLRFPANLLWIATTESQQYANDRLPYLFQVPAHSPEHYGASIEPLLGPIRLRETYRTCPACGKESTVLDNRCPVENAGIPRLGWVAIGCESGEGRRDTAPAWIGEIIRDCRRADIPTFLKQMDIGGKVVKTPGWEGAPCVDLPLSDWGKE